MTKASDILKLSADTAESLEHCKGTFAKMSGDRVEACCTEGAMHLADLELLKSADDKDSVFLALREARRCVKRVLGYDPSDLDVIVAWNDRKTTTKEDVVRVLRAAATLAQREEGEGTG